MQLIRIAALAAAIACSALSLQAQSKGKGKAKGKAVPAAKVTPALTAPTDGPTFCYALGVAQGESMKNYLISREGVDSAYVKYAIEGMNATLSDDERKRRIAFAAGMRIAEMNQKQLPMIAKQAAGANDSAYINIPAFQRGLTEAALGQNTTFSADSAMKLVDAQLKFQRDTYKHDNVHGSLTTSSSRASPPCPAACNTACSPRARAQWPPTAPRSKCTTKDASSTAPCSTPPTSAASPPPSVPTKSSKAGARHSR